MGLGRSGIGRGDLHWHPSRLGLWTQKLAIAGRNIEHRGAPTPLLPLDRQNMQEAGVVTPLRKVANGHGGLRAPESQLPQKGTRVTPQIFTDARTECRMISREHFG